MALNFECDRPDHSGRGARPARTARRASVVDDAEANYFPMPQDASGTFDFLVGRIRQDLSDPTGPDRAVRRGRSAAEGRRVNAVQIAESLLADQKTIAA